jgi:3-mercaptopyruvate sulfurtransferase SseA
VASFLEKQGQRAFALKGGYMAWLRAGYPVERKTATAALPARALCPECDQPTETHAGENEA